MYCVCCNGCDILRLVYICLNLSIVCYYIEDFFKNDENNINIFRYKFFFIF